MIYLSHAHMIKQLKCSICEFLKILRGHAKDISSIAIISDEILISGSYCEIKVWDVESGTCLQTFNDGHTHYIRSIVQISTIKK